MTLGRTVKEGDRIAQLVLERVCNFSLWGLIKGWRNG